MTLPMPFLKAWILVCMVCVAPADVEYNVISTLTMSMVESVFSQFGANLSASQQTTRDKWIHTISFTLYSDMRVWDIISCIFYYSAYAVVLLSSQYQKYIPFIIPIGLLFLLICYTNDTLQSQTKWNSIGLGFENSWTFHTYVCLLTVITNHDSKSDGHMVSVMGLLPDT